MFNIDDIKNNIIRKVTMEEVEQFRLKSFNELNELKNESNSLYIELKDLYIEKENLDEKYSTLKSDYIERLLAKIGKGKYYHICSKPIEIKEKLTSLKNDTYNYYNNEENSKKVKEYKLLKGNLEEDLKQAEIEFENFMLETEKVEQDYNKIKEERNRCIIKIQKIKLKIIRLENFQNKKIRDIKSLENAHKNNKSVFVKKYKI